jgi:hypothetical protein
MPLLCEFAITPEVFSMDSYESEHEFRLNLSILKDNLMDGGIVRNFRNGDWLKNISMENPSVHFKGKELVRKLEKQNRLKVYPKQIDVFEDIEASWIREAVSINEKYTPSGIICARDLDVEFLSNEHIKPIKELDKALWWKSSRQSIRLTRCMDSYIDNLNLLFSCVNSALFIDPYIDPTDIQYKHFFKLFELLARQELKPSLVQVHRLSSIGSGPSREPLSLENWKERFSKEWEEKLNNLGLRVDIFLWDEIHDRYFLSDLMGINLPYGFSTTSRKDSFTTWTKLEKDDINSIWKEFEPCSTGHVLQGKFTLGNYR